MPKDVSPPGNELREGLQPLMPSAVTVRNDRSGDSRQRLQPRGQIVGDGSNAPLTGLRISSRNFDELLLASQTHVLPVEGRDLSGTKPGKKADGYGSKQRTAFLITRARCNELPCLRHGEDQMASSICRVLSICSVGSPSRQPRLQVHRKKARRWRMVALRLAGFSYLVGGPFRQQAASWSFDLAELSRSANRDFSHNLTSNEGPSNRHPTHLCYDSQKEIS